ncbi:unnamed protein product [Mytilus edulis]|uniref:Uncharacterized protein n=1 Tax=Mytilus edulis TaxID=6550 RepID=A0A8S3UYY5_MYTED|nr:unnamed protein product [Mytilus edulis]
MNSKLAKLDMLDDLCSRMASIESHFNIVKTEIKDIRYDLKQQSERITNGEYHYNIVESRVCGIEAGNEKLQNENFELKENLLKMQTHSMKYNLIFSGIKESNERQNEKVEDTIKEFISNELKIDNEISNRRKDLIPNIIALKREGRQNVRLVLDKLYVGNHLYNDHETPYPPRSRQDAIAHGPQPGFVPSRERFPSRTSCRPSISVRTHRERSGTVSQVDRESSDNKVLSLNVGVLKSNYNTQSLLNL